MLELREEIPCVMNGLFASKINRFSTELEGGCFTFRGYPREPLDPSYLTCHSGGRERLARPARGGSYGKGLHFEGVTARLAPVDKRALRRVCRPRFHGASQFPGDP